ncbi:alpha-ketoglutarate-dependent dioxygenase AlkB [Enhydrobacter aerosaccus]|nr:alpha-ketoglutarate-dependent dioxygenase AlkB [Enhydrobacter aerosaccus]
MQVDLFGGGNAAGPEGFRYRPDVLSPSEEASLVKRFAALPFAPFEFHGFLGKRRIVSYGWRYDYAAEKARPTDPIPDFLLPLRRRAAQTVSLPLDSLQQALITEYAPGAAIGWHRDKPMFQDVIALSFLSPCRLRLRRRKAQGWERWAIEVQPRSLYLLRGVARHEWEHSIPALEALRYSVTFRTVRDRPGPIAL